MITTIKEHFVPKLTKTYRGRSSLGKRLDLLKLPPYQNSE